MKTNKNNLTKSLFKAFILIAAIVFAVFYWFSARQIQMVQMGTETSEEMSRDPIEFSLKDTHGNVVKLSQFIGKPIILNFWATWCPPCLDEMPSFIKFSQWAKQNGIIVLAISVDNSLRAVQKFFTEKKLWIHGDLPFTILLNSNSQVANSYGVSQFPETLFIDKKYKVIRNFIGPQNWDSQEIKEWVISHTN